MGLFGFGKKAEHVGKTDKKCTVTSVKVLGSGCASCHTLYENAKSAVADLGLAVEVEYVTDLEKIMEAGVMSMPALIADGKVVSAGKVLKPAEIKKLLLAV